MLILEDVLKDLTSFLEEELNNTIDEISEIKTSLSKIEIDINTSMSFHHSLNSSKDSTIDFFMSDNEKIVLMMKKYLILIPGFLN